MLTTNTKQLNSTFERIVRDKNGVLVRVRFIVVEVNGQFQPQIISAEPFLQKKKAIICLPTPISIPKAIYPYKLSFVSKLFPTEFLEFFMSQPTRAPSFR